MRTFHRLITAGALSAPLLIGGAGLASADALYAHDAAWAGPNGAASHSVLAFADDGNAFFHEEAAAAGPNGAGAFSTTSWAGDDWGDGGGDDGASATYYNQVAFASDEGAYYEQTYSHADSDD
ncbi:MULTISPECIES: hypothetical protein [unclassified Saccharothrix]|uniref:hypothetical protein n=1 Tax=unclassified Saccharothrix TaxID=2593673 RepID=UPI00307D58BA